MRYAQRKRSKKPYVIGTVLTIALLAVIGLKWTSSGNQAEISQATPSKHAAARGNQKYDGAYMTFTYSGRYQLSKLKAQNDDLELAALTADTNYEKKAAVAVSKLHGDLTTNTGYNLRANRPDLYAERQVTVDGGQAVIWTKLDGTEVTAYIPHSSKVAVLAFTSQAETDGLPGEVGAVLESFHWKE